MTSLAMKALQIIECRAAAMGVENGVESHLVRQLMHMAGAVGEKVPWPHLAGFWFGSLAGVLFFNHLYVSQVRVSQQGKQVPEGSY